MEEFRTETPIAAYRLMDGIFQCILKPDLIVDERLAKRLVAERLSVLKGDSFPTLIIIPSEHLLYENGANHYLASDEGLKQVSALAIVVKTPLRNLLSNISMLFYKNSVPFRLFTSRREAQLWLFDYVKDKELVEF